MVIPPDLVDRFVAVRHAMDIFPPYLHQEVMADFIVEGHFTRHIRKMRQVYKERRSVLIDSLAREFPAHRGFEVHGVEAGMHLAMTLPHGLDDRAISARAARSRLWLWPLSPSYTSSTPRPGFILGFGSSLPEQIPRAVRLMRSLIASA
jgi:GntR family transcriptional regulator/MocR family aminotransferase